MLTQHDILPVSPAMARSALPRVPHLPTRHGHDSESPGVLQSLRDACSLIGNKFLERFVYKAEIERLYLVMGGAIFFETLSAAVELDLFTHLRETPSLTTAEIAARLGLEEKPTRILLLGCTSLGLLKKSKDTYKNTRLSHIALTRQSPKNVLSVVRWQHHINYRPLHRLLDALRENSNVGLDQFQGSEPYLYGRLSHHPELENIFQDAMEHISVQANEQLVRFVDFSAYRYVVDVGGGNGTNVLALAKRYPHLRASVFDAASVCALARDNIEKEGRTDRVDALVGNCFADPFPPGADCFLFCHFFPIWSEERNRLLLKKTFEALPVGGSVILFNMMQNNEGDGPLSAAMGSPYFLTLATGEGMLYTWREYETWMREAGFSTVRSVRLIRDHGVIVGTKEGP